MKRAHAWKCQHCKSELKCVILLILSILDVERLCILFCQVYLNWANSVLSNLGELPCEGVSSIQEGRVLCQLIDKLCSDAGLSNKVEVGGKSI